jgi:formylmethanofuran dehydrogenase subunit E
MNMENMLREITSFRGRAEPGVAYGIKMVLAAKDSLKIHDLKKANLCAIAETTRCLPDAIEFLTGCTVGNGRLIIKDHSKMAASFVDLDTKRAVRVTVIPEFQRKDVAHSKKSVNLKRQRKFKNIARHHARHALEIIKTPDKELLRVQEIKLIEPIPAARSPTKIVFCEKCGESVREEKARVRDGQILCLVCAGEEKPYFKPKYRAKFF